jgi:hypothetical protein
MPLDASLILGGRGPQLDDPMTVQAKRATLADLMGRQQMQQFQIEGEQRQRQDAQTLADLYRSAGNDEQALIQGMAQRGLGARIPAFQEQQAKLGKATTENQAAKYKLMKEQIADTDSALQAMLSDPQLSSDKVVSFLADRAAMFPDQRERLSLEAKNLPGEPGRLRQKILEKLIANQEAGKQVDLIFGKTEMQDQGGARQAFTTNQLTGQITPGQSFAKTATPGEVMASADRAAALAQQARESAAGRSQSAAQFNQRLAFDREQAAKATPATVSATQKVTDANEAIQLINQAEPLLKGSTGSYGGVAIDTLAQAFGVATPGAINAQQLKAIEGALVAKMPKMSGPQSDKDVALYRQMAAVIGDATIPYAQKAAALEQVRSIQERYAGVIPGSSRPAPPPKPAAPGDVLRFDSMGRPIP